MAYAAMVTHSNYGFDMMGTLVGANGKTYNLGDLGKWYGRRWGISGTEFHSIGVEIKEDNSDLSNAEIWAAIWLLCAREEHDFDTDDQVYAALDSSESWDIYA